MEGLASFLTPFASFCNQCFTVHSFLSFRSVWIFASLLQLRSLLRFFSSILSLTSLLSLRTLLHFAYALEDHITVLSIVLWITQLHSRSTSTPLLSSLLTFIVYSLHKPQLYIYLSARTISDSCSRESVIVIYAKLHMSHAAETRTNCRNLKLRCT